MNITSFFVSIFFLNLSLFLAYTFGYSVYSFFYKNLSTKNFNINYYCAIPIIGFAILSIIASYLFFIFNLSSSAVSYIILIIFLCTFFFIRTDIKNFVNFFFKIALQVNPIFILIISFLLTNGEEFYIFRGNYWDNMNYISQAILIQDYKFSEILKFNNFLDYSYIHNGTKAIEFRPLTSFFLAQFFNLKVFSFFFNLALYKTFLISLVFLSMNFLAQILNLKNKYFFSIVFISSFWLIYVVEIDALSHLSSIPFFIFCLALLLHSKETILINKNFNIELFTLVFTAMFFIYVEISPIFLIVCSIFFIFKYNKHLFLLDNLKLIFFYILVFLFLSLPMYSITYEPLLTQIKIGLRSDITYWAYFSMFIIGKDNVFLTNENINLIKEVLANKKNNLMLIENLINILLEAKYYLIPLNIIPSLLGLYYLTISSIINIQNLFFVIFLLILNYYLIKIFINNFKLIFSKDKNNLFYIFKSSFLTLLLFTLLFLIKNGYWQLTKLYIYLGPIIFLFMCLRLNKLNDVNTIKLNKLYLVLLLLFPLYKFSTSNDGIGRYDTFPSIINPKYKKNLNWELNDSEYLACSEVFINSKDPIINGYVSIKLRDIGFEHFGPHTYISKSNNILLKNCKIDLKKNKIVLSY